MVHLQPQTLQGAGGSFAKPVTFLISSLVCVSGMNYYNGENSVPLIRHTNMESSYNNMCD